MRGEFRFITGQVAVLSVISVMLVFLGQMRLRIFLTLALVSFLLMIELTAPTTVTPTWQRRVRWVSVVALVLAGLFMTVEIVRLWPPGVS